MTMGTRIAVMNNGELQQVGPPQQLYDKPVNKFVAGFIGSPSMNFVPVTVEGGNGAAATLKHGGAITVPLPDRLRNAVGPTTGRSLTAGFRPEHMEIGEAGEQAAKLRATVDVVEFLGNEELLHLRVGDEDLVAIVDSSQRVKPGDVVDMYIPLDKLHLFDEENGLALGAIKPQQKQEAAATTAA